MTSQVAGGQSHFGVKMHDFSTSFFSFKTKACGWNDAKYLSMCYFACQIQTIINVCSLYLISNSWRPRWRPCLVTSQTSSSATTHKIYLILSRRSKAFHRRQNCFEILQHQNSRERFHQFPPAPSPHLHHGWGLTLRVLPRVNLFRVRYFFFILSDHSEKQATERVVSL